MLRQADDRNWDRGVSLIARRRGTFPSAKGFQLVILVAILVTAANHLFALDMQTVQAVKVITNTTLHAASFKEIPANPANRDLRTLGPRRVDLAARYHHS